METPPEMVVVSGRWEVPADPVPCADPVVGIDRLTDEANARGLIVPETSSGPTNPDDRYPPGEGLATMAILGEDMDDDGDVDLIAVNHSPLRLRNDGAGTFEELPAIDAALLGPTVAMGAAELTGDRIIDLIGVRPADDETDESEMVLYRGLGDFEFGPPEVTPSGMVGRAGEPSTLALGDADGDGDLDVFFTARTSVVGTGGPVANRVFLNDGEGQFSSSFDLVGYGGWGTVALVATWTDRDGDGDQDLYILGGDPTFGVAPNNPPSAFYRNDGLGPDGQPVFVEEAAALGLASTFSAMGVDSTDWNEDGQLDYCATDVGPIRCFVSSPEGYVETGVAMGLVPELPVMDWPQTIGWSLDLADLDHDGWLDVLQASAPDHGGVWSGTTEFPALLFQGRPDGTFRDVTEETGFGSSATHFGMVTADVDGNGWLDVLMHAEDFGDQPILMMNRCGLEAWLEVEFVGAPENRSGIGARVTADLGTRKVVRGVAGLRALAMGPTRFHVGLGAMTTLPTLTVGWPDGVTTRLEQVPTRRKITAYHPRAEE